MKISQTIQRKSTALLMGTAAALSLGVVSAKKADAAVVPNDANVYTTKTTTNVYDKYETNKVKHVKQVLPANTDWKIIKTAYDAQGNKWYDLGKNQWVKAKSVTLAKQNTHKYIAKPAQKPVTQNTQNTQTANNTQTTQAVHAQTQNTQTQTQVQPQQQTRVYTNYNQNQQVSNRSYSQPARSTSSASNYTSSATGSEASAKAWIAQHESGGSYTARNGRLA